MLSGLISRWQINFSCKKATPLINWKAIFFSSYFKTSVPLLLQMKLLKDWDDQNIPSPKSILEFLGISTKNCTWWLNDGLYPSWNENYLLYIEVAIPHNVVFWQQNTSFLFYENTCWQGHWLPLLTFVQFNTWIWNGRNFHTSILIKKGFVIRKEKMKIKVGWFFSRYWRF